MRRRWSSAVAGLSISCPLQPSILTVTTTPHLTSQLSKMGERLPGQKSYVCSFFDCKAKFSKSWKLEAHLCKHTGLVSGFTRPEANRSCGDVVTPDDRINLYFFCPICFSHLRNLSPVRAATGASALATSSPDMNSTTAGKSHTSMRLEEERSMFLQLVFSLIFLVFRCLVDGCPEAFVTNGSLKNHMARVHDKREKQYRVLGPCPPVLFWFYGHGVCSCCVVAGFLVWPSRLREELQQEEPAEGPSVRAPRRSTFPVSEAGRDGTGL